LPLATNGTQELSPNRNPKISQSSASPLYKEILQILPKLQKVEGKTKKLPSFFCRDEEVSLSKAKKFAIFDGKVTNKYVSLQTKRGDKKYKP
jgi:hypothetical protein